jgi:putative phosphoribosyl transferase
VIFADRADAGRRLGDVVGSTVRDAAVVVLGIPRCGVVVAEGVANALGATLDVVVPRKLGAPGNPELGIGAVARGATVIDRRALERLRVSERYLEDEILAQESEIERREHAYRAGRPPLELAGATAVVVDDGIATGGTAVAALRAVRAAGAVRIVLAVPVAPRAALATVRPESDDVVALATPEPFLAVGEWYGVFEQTTDAEVVAALARSRDHAA